MTPSIAYRPLTDESELDWVHVQHDQVDLLSFTSTDLLIPLKWEIDGFFQKYVSQFCPRYSVDAVIALIEQGLKLLMALRNNTAEEIPYQQRREWIAPLVWAFMFTAYKRNEAFNQGMFVFDDPDYRLVNFFSVVATSRPSSHFKKRREDSWGIDVDQNYVTGLPSGHQTAHFGRLKEDSNGQKRSFLKPENWGMESWWQWLGHATDFVWTRVHNPDDEYKRKEHCSKEVTEYFKQLYSNLTHHSDLPPDIKTFGISGMVRFLMHFLETNPQDEKIHLIPPFLEWLDANYPDIPNLNRVGDEVILSESILFEELLIASSTEYTKFRAFLQLKTAKEPDEIISALSALLEFKEDFDWMPQPTIIPDNIAVYDKKGDKKREAIFYQVKMDLQRSCNENEIFTYNGKPFGGSVEDLFSELTQWISDENHALNALALMSQGVKEAMTTHMIQVMCSPIPGLVVTAYCGSAQVAAQVDVSISPDRVFIEIWQTYALRSSDVEKKTFREEPYAFLKGWTQIYLPTDPKHLQKTTAYIKWAINNL